ncbi:flavodoxin family protein [Salimicrobium album]|uniref:Multimeric flavodoxin WrbA n=1 Tax=Salimicrobium album TaxID=50717 RepID=A0A1H3IVL1_9BACI|nr:flavodoxin family protein [Salimicrobium album]SDY31776.1 Multimeric flavodoxin WrbA [Salimicrobium album]
MSTIQALFLNGSLKDSNDDSNTHVLFNEVAEIMEKEGASVEEIRLADYDIKFGMAPDMGDGDEWPKIFDKVKKADIVIMGTPIWIGEKSSVTTMAMERLYASSGETQDNGQSIYYNKVGGAVVTGNEDGAKHASASLLYGLSHIGFTIPPNVDAYWVGEAGPGPSYMETDRDNEFTKSHVKMLAYNTLHLARILKNTPIPPEGNTME